MHVCWSIAGSSAVASPPAQSRVQQYKKSHDGRPGTPVCFYFLCRDTRRGLWGSWACDRLSWWSKEEGSSGKQSRSHSCLFLLGSRLGKRLWSEWGWFTAESAVRSTGGVASTGAGSLTGVFMCAFRGIWPLLFCSCYSAYLYACMTSPVLNKLLSHSSGPGPACWGEAGSQILLEGDRLLVIQRWSGEQRRWWPEPQEVGDP